MRRISERGLTLIKSFEGFSPWPYRCPAGILTIGYGHVVGAGEEFPEAITLEQGAALLAKDVGVAEKAVARLIGVRLTENQFAALVSFTFNLGGGALQRSTLRRKVNSWQHGDIKEEFMKWVWAGGRKLPGLIRRRVAEARLYMS